MYSRNEYSSKEEYETVLSEFLRKHYVIPMNLKFDDYCRWCDGDKRQLMLMVRNTFLLETEKFFCFLGLLKDAADEALTLYKIFNEISDLIEEQVSSPMADNFRQENIMCISVVLGMLEDNEDDEEWEEGEGE